MTWVDLSGAFGYGTKLTSTQQQNLRDNIAALAAGDTGAPSIVEAALGNNAVSPAKLKTSQGSVNGVGNHSLPGGTYSFYPEVKRDGGTSMSANIATDITSTIYIRNINLTETGGATPYAQDRYVTASGEVFWVFILRDKTTKQIISMWQAPDHPCFGNGEKSNLIPHPFGDFDSAVQEIIVINPSKEEVKTIQEKTIVADSNKPNKDFLEVILEEYEIDEISNPQWPTKEVTVGLPPDWHECWLSQELIKPIKMKIPKPVDVLCKALKLKNGKSLKIK